jgi:hypothetical protein
MGKPVTVMSAETKAKLISERTQDIINAENGVRLHAELARLKAENERLRALIGPGEIVAGFRVDGCVVCSDDLGAWIYRGDEPLIGDDDVADTENKALRDVKPQPVSVGIVVLKGGSND